MLTPKRAASRPLDVPVTALELNRFCHTTASVHCGMMYGKMKIELKYFLQARSVLVMRNANRPPYKMETTHVPTASRTVLRSGVQRFVLAMRLVKRSM